MMINNEINNNEDIDFDSMLFTDVDDCSICPFSRENENLSLSEYICNGHPDSYHPCEWMEKYEGMTCSEVVSSVESSMHEAELYWERRYLAEKEKEEKKAIIAAQRNQSRLENYSLNKEIQRYRKAIKQREASIYRIVSYRSAFNFADTMMGQGKLKERAEIEKEIPQVAVWREEIERYKFKLDELIKERNKRNRERRKSR